MYPRALQALRQVRYFPPRSASDALSGLASGRLLPAMHLAGRLIHSDPILVCGAPRTGTSWAAKVLSLGGNIRYLREPLSHGGYAADAGLSGTPYLAAGDEDAEYEALWRRVLSIDPLLNRRWLMSESRPLVRRFPFWRARLLVKEVICPLALDWLSERFRMRVVIMVRHPCGYVASGLRLREIGHQVLELDGLLAQPRLMARYFPNDRGWLAELTDPVARMAAAYGMVYKVVGEQAASHLDWTIVRHETLCDEPHQSFQRLCRAVDANYSRSVVKYLAKSTANRDNALYSLNRVSNEVPDRWKTELTSRQIDTVAAVISRFQLPFYRDFA